MTDHGILMVAFGENAQREVQQAQKLLSGYSIRIMSDVASLPPVDGLGEFNDAQKSRWAKMTMDLWSPFGLNLYLDADTRVYGDVRLSFLVLEQGWDVALAFSENQGGAGLWHIGEDDKLATLQDLGLPEAMQLQAGVMFWRKSEKVSAFFRAWRTEWLKFKNQDQGALLRALDRVPLRIWLLGRAWNGGAVIGHRYGFARHERSSHL